MICKKEHNHIMECYNPDKSKLWPGYIALILWVLTLAYIVLAAGGAITSPFSALERVDRNLNCVSTSTNSQGEEYCVNIREAVGIILQRQNNTERVLGCMIESRCEGVPEDVVENIRR